MTWRVLPFIGTTDAPEWDAPADLTALWFSDGVLALEPAGVGSSDLILGDGHTWEITAVLVSPGSVQALQLERRL